MNNISNYPEQRHKKRNNEGRKKRADPRQYNMSITVIPHGIFFFQGEKENFKKRERERDERDAIIKRIHYQIFFYCYYTELKQDLRFKPAD